MKAFIGARRIATVEKDGSTVIVKMHAGHKRNTSGAGIFTREGGTRASAIVQR